MLVFAREVTLYSLALFVSYIYTYVWSYACSGHGWMFYICMELCMQWPWVDV